MLFLRTGVRRASLKAAGITYSSRDRLMTFVITGRRKGKCWLKNYVGKGSRPKDMLFVFMIIFFTSSVETCENQPF